METLAESNAVLTAALAGHDAGLCVIPASSNGTKAPLGQWKRWTRERPTIEQLQVWFDVQGNVGMGVVCGEVSGRLECVEIEGAFRFRYGEVRSRLEGAGLLEEWDRWLTGYAEQSPSGGIHVLVRVAGEGQLPGNTKLALGPERQCWIETRGEGGFVIVAPSGGPVHPTGKPWELKAGSFADIATTTAELFEAVCDLLSSFDESPAAETPAFTTQPGHFDGEGWIGAALDKLPPIQQVLQDRGWVYVRTEPRGQLWRRPGKAHGHSARVNHSSRLYVFSSSTPFPLGPRTYDALDIMLTYDLGHVPSADERTARLREFRPQLEAVLPTPAGPSNDPQVPDAAAAAQAAGIGALILPPDFWRARDYLSHIYVAALASRVSPDSLWMATKTMYAATIPWNFRLPDNGTLDYIGVMAGPSGSGKTRSKQAALELLTLFRDLPGIHIGLPPGTGEGMTEFYLKREQDGTQSFKARGAGFYIDEGTWLFDTAARSGNTTIQALKMAWSGELTGSLAGSAERNRFLPPRAVRFAMLIGIQPGIAASFMRKDLTDGGLPQRICWSWTQHPDYPDDRPDYPGPLEVALWLSGEHDAMTQITYCSEIERELAAQQRAAVTGAGTVAMNAHEGYAKLKSAALHALMDGRTVVSPQDWALATLEWETSDKIRSHILATERAAASDLSRARGVARAQEELAADTVYLERAALSLARKLRDSPDGLSLQKVKDAVNQYKRRYGIHHSEIIDLAIRRGLCVKDGTLYRIGQVVP